MRFMKEKIFAAVLILAIALLFFHLSGLHGLFNLSNVESAKKIIMSYGIISPIVYMLIMAIAIVVSPIPSVPLAVASGALFGPALGTIYSLIGAETGAIISFYIARVFGRVFVERILHRHIIFCDSCTEKYIAYFIFFSRMLPIFHFDIISYGAGLTKITLKKFAVATFFGMVPMTFLFVYYGKVIFLGNLFSIAFTILLIIAIFLVPVLIKKYNILSLKDKIE